MLSNVNQWLSRYVHLTSNLNRTRGGQGPAGPSDWRLRRAHCVLKRSFCSFSPQVSRKQQYTIFTMFKKNRPQKSRNEVLFLWWSPEVHTDLRYDEVMSAMFTCRIWQLCFCSPWRSTHEYRFWFWNLRRCCSPCPHPKSIACGLRFATGSRPLFHTGRIFAGLSQSLCGSNVCHHCMGKVQSRFWKVFVGKATFSAFRLHPRKLLLVTWTHLLYQCYPISIW